MISCHRINNIVPCREVEAIFRKFIFSVFLEEMSETLPIESQKIIYLNMHS